MPGLTNKYIENLGQLICGDNFIGVYPCDIQPEFKNKLCNFSVIFNTDKHNEKGSHFVAVFRKKNEIFYFDSFGKKCENEMIKKFIKTNLSGKKYRYNNICIQNDKSLLCGLYCISFIKSQTNKKPFKKFLTNFKKDTILNDTIVTKMIVDSI